ncbi:uridine kinase, partial [Pseudonocardia sp. SID8383]|nr:uridine kinase [Pseudonocardia sp. SID8383]
MAGAFRPVDRAGLAAHLAERAGEPSGRVRVLVDGAPPAAPLELARAVAER